MDSRPRARYLVLVLLLASTLFLAGCTDAIRFGTPEYQVDAQEEDDAADPAADDVNETGDVNETSSVEETVDLDEGYVSATYDDSYERVKVELTRMPGDADRVEVDFGGTATAKAALYEPGDEVVLTSEKLITRGGAEDMSRQLYSPSGQGGFSGVKYGETVEVAARAVSADSRTLVYEEERVLGADEVQANVEYFFDSGRDEVVIVYASNVNADYLDASIQYDGTTVAEARLNEPGDEVRMSADTPFLHTSGKAENLMATELEENVEEHRSEFEELHEEARYEFRMAVRSNFEYPTPGMSKSDREERQRQLHQLQRAADDVHEEFDELESLGDSVEHLDRADGGNGDTEELSDYQETVNDLADDWDNTDDFTDVGNGEVGDLESDVDSDLSTTTNQFKRPDEDEIMTVEVTAHVAPKTTRSGVRVRGGTESEILSYQGALRSDGYSESVNGTVDLRTREVMDSGGSDDAGTYASLDTEAVADRVRSILNQEAEDTELQSTFERSSNLDRAAEENSERLASNVDLQAHMTDVESGELPAASSRENRVARMSRHAATSCAGATDEYPFNVGDVVQLTDDETGEVTHIASSATSFRMADDTRHRVSNYLLYDLTSAWRSGGENVAAVTPDEAEAHGGGVEGVADAAVEEFQDSGGWMDGSFDTHGVGVTTTEQGVVYVTRTMC